MYDEPEKVKINESWPEETVQNILDYIEKQVFTYANKRKKTE